MAKSKDTFSARLLNWLGLDATRDPSSTVVLKAGELAPASELPATVRERYQVVRTLGRGAFGTVFLAKDQLIGRLIAIKQLFPKYRQSDDIRQRFLQEARIAGQLENPNIVTIYDVEDDGRTSCIIMEYLAGGHLRNILDRQGPLSEETSLIYMQGILNGLAAAHAMGVVHRDIKPSNILFDQYGTPKISDFGVATLPPADDGSGLDDTTTAAGTPEYMAPEQFELGRKADARTDLYSAGLLFYEMLTDERVFSFGGKALTEIAATITQADVPTLLDFPEQVSPTVQDLVVRLVQKQPADRLPDAKSVVAELEAALVELREGAAAGEVIGGEAKGDRSEMYADVLRLFLVDGVISPPERHELQKRAQRLGITPAKARRLETQIRQELGLPLLEHLEEYRVLAEQLLSDRDFSPEDERILRDLGARYAISLEEQRKIEELVLTKFHMK